MRVYTNTQDYIYIYIIEITLMGPLMTNSYGLINV